MNIAFITMRRDPSLPDIDCDGGIVALNHHADNLAANGHKIDIFTAHANKGWGNKEYIQSKSKAQDKYANKTRKNIRIIHQPVQPIRRTDHHQLDMIEMSNLFASTFSYDLLNAYECIVFFHPTSAYGILRRWPQLREKAVLFPLALSELYKKSDVISSEYCKMESYVLNHIALAFPVSIDEQHQLKMLQPSLPTILGPRTIDTSVFGYNKRSASNITSPVIISSVGTIRPRKAQEKLIKTAFILKQQNIACMIKIIGDNNTFFDRECQLYYESLLTLIDELDVKDSITFTGKKTKQEIVKLHHSSHIGLYPSQAESFGNAVLESIATGTPTIISNNIPAYSMFAQSGINSLIVDPNPEAFADAIMLLIKNKSLYEQISKEGAKTAQLHTWGELSAILENTLIRLATPSLQ